MVTLNHDLRNEGLWPVELAPWALTQLKLGGVAILPQPIGDIDEDGDAANRHLVLWPYTQWGDPRLKLREAAILIEARPQLPPVKVGYPNPLGWLAYWRAGVLFTKWFRHQPGQNYPDRGCNAESFCNHRFIELESLGPLTRLEPGQSVRHMETWELSTSLQVPHLAGAIYADLMNSLQL